MKTDSIAKAVGSVISKWEEQGKAVRARMSSKGYRAVIREATWEVLGDAYLQASDDGRLPVLAKQIMYAARPAILEKSGELELDSQYFVQELLPDYMRQYCCGDWKVVFDVQGTFHEPHNRKNVPLGQYLDDIDFDRERETEFELFPTVGPRNRYGAILFISNEGFLPLLSEAKITERFDVAILTANDLSPPVVRELINQVCGEHDIPLFVLRNIDAAGFNIVGDLRRDDIEVIDIGLRLEDADKYGLQSEAATYKGGLFEVSRDLWRNGAADEEIAFLCQGGTDVLTYGERVELEAFTSPQFVEWLEASLELHGIGKVVPDDLIAERAYRLALELSIVRDRVQGIEEQAAEIAADAVIPDDLRRQITNALNGNRSQSWDEVVMSIAEANAVSLGQ